MENAKRTPRFRRIKHRLMAAWNCLTAEEYIMSSSRKRKDGQDVMQNIASASPELRHRFIQSEMEFCEQVGAPYRPLGMGFGGDILRALENAFGNGKGDVGIHYIDEQEGGQNETA